MASKYQQISIGPKIKYCSFPLPRPTQNFFCQESSQQKDYQDKFQTDNQ